MPIGSEQVVEPQRLQFTLLRWVKGQYGRVVYAGRGIRDHEL